MLLEIFFGRNPLVAAQKILDIQLLWMILEVSTLGEASQEQ